MNNQTNPTPIEQIAAATQRYRRQYDVLADRVGSLEHDVEAIKRRRMPGIKSAVQAAAEARSELAALIEQHPDQFQKPRTLTIAGIRVGWMKGKGKIVWDNAISVCRQIRKHFPDQAETLIKITEAPVRRALANLTTAEIKRIGATVEDTADEIIIKAVDGEVDKLVNALLAEAEQWEVAA